MLFAEAGLSEAARQDPLQYAIFAGLAEVFSYSMYIIPIVILAVAYLMYSVGKQTRNNQS